VQTNSLGLGPDWFPYHRSLARVSHSGPRWPGLLDVRAFCLVTRSYTIRLGAECDWLPCPPISRLVFFSLCAWPHVLTCTERAWFAACDRFFCTAGARLAAPFCIVRVRPTTPSAKPNMNPLHPTSLSAPHAAKQSPHSLSRIRLLSSETLLPCIFPPGGVFPLDFVGCWAHHDGLRLVVSVVSLEELTKLFSISAPPKSSFTRTCSGVVTTDSPLPAMPRRTSRAAGSEHWFDVSPSFTTSPAETYDDTSSAAATRTHEIQHYRHQNAKVIFYFSSLST
jgi:hypothetical protein